MKKRIKTYQLLQEVAAGGHATVHRVWDSHTNQALALKVLHPHLSKDPAYLARFEREATLASSLDHPNVVRIYEVGKAGESHFIAMEFLPLTLAHLLKSGGSISANRAVDIARQVATGLEAAHRRGIIHRDIKPQNILLDIHGNAKITDFGIARTLEFSTMTRAGLVMGTPQYMAPEQAKGTPPDIRADIYSLGILLYQMLAGRLPFQGATPWEIIRQHVEEKPEALDSGIPSDLARIVQKCLAKEPDERFQTPAALAEVLTLVQKGLPKLLADDITQAMRDVASSGVSSGPPTLPLPQASRPPVLTGYRARVLAVAAVSVAALLFIAPAMGLVRLPSIFERPPVVVIDPATPTPAIATPMPTTAAATVTPLVPVVIGTAVAPSPTPTLDFFAVHRDIGPLTNGQTGTIALTDEEAKNLGILSVDVMASRPIPLTVLTVSRLTGRRTPTGPPNVPYAYLQMTSPGLSSNSIAKLSVIFQVPKAWLTAEGVPTSAIALYSYDGQWAKLPTVSAGTNADGVLYRAEAAGLSYFAIVGVPGGEVAPTPTPPAADVLVIQQTLSAHAESALFAVASSPWKLRYRTTWTGEIMIMARTSTGPVTIVEQPVQAGLENETYIYDVLGTMSLSAMGLPIDGGWTLSVTGNPTTPAPGILGILSYTGTSRANSPPFEVATSPWLLRYETTWTGPFTLTAVWAKGAVPVFSGEVTAGVTYETYVYGAVGKMYLSAKNAPADGRWVVRVTANPTPNPPPAPGLLTYIGIGKINSPPFTVDKAPWKLVYVATWSGVFTLVAQTADGPKVIVDREVEAGVTYETIVQGVTGRMHLAVTAAPPDRAWSIYARRLDA